MSKTSVRLSVVGLLLIPLVMPLLGQRPIAGDVPPVNNLPNPFEQIDSWGTLPEGRSWGSVPAVNIDPDGRSLWVLERCGTKSWQSGSLSSCAGQTLPPLMKFDTRSGKMLHAIGSGLFVFPHALGVDGDGNLWVAD